MSISPVPYDVDQFKESLTRIQLRRPDLAATQRPRYADRRVAREFPGSELPTAMMDVGGFDDPRRG